MSPLGCAPLETAQPLPGCAPMEVGRGGDVLVVALEVDANCTVFHVFQASLCNCRVFGEWVAATLCFIVKGRNSSGTSHGVL